MVLILVSEGKKRKINPTYNGCWTLEFGHLRDYFCLTNFFGKCNMMCVVRL